jgi:simple sugar transport system permease protein
MLETLAQLFLSIDFLQASIRFSTPLLGASMGEALSERAGMVNVSLEGMMLSGALGGALGVYYTGNPWLGVMCGILASVLVAALQGFFSITLAVNQVVVGIALNVFCLGATTFISRSVFSLTESNRVQGFTPVRLPVLGQIPVLGDTLFNHSALVYLTYLLIPVVALVLTRTKWGLNLRAVGEHPEAADSLGISVVRKRYTAVLLCGAFAGLAGCFFSLVQLNQFVEGMTGGRGFIALAVVIVGKWQPWRLALVSLLFGMLDAVALRAQALDIGLPYQLLLALPYVVTLLVYAGLVGQARPPAALAQPYIRE